MYGNEAAYNNNASVTTELLAMTRSQVYRCQHNKGNGASATPAKMPVQYWQQPPQRTTLADVVDDNKVGYNNNATMTKM